MKLKIILIYILVCLIWGSTWLAIKIGLEELTPLFSASLRFIVAALAIGLLAYSRKLTIQTDRASVRIYVYLGLLTFALPFTLIYWAQKHVPSGLASVLFSVYPFFVALFSKLLIDNNEVSKAKVFSLVLGFLGIVLLFLEKIVVDFDFSLWGMLAIVSSGIIQAYVAILIKKDGKHLNVLTMNFIPLLIASAILLPVSLVFEDISLAGVGVMGVSTILYLGVFGTVITFTSYYWLLKKINIVLLSLIAFITPIIALFLGWVVYNETLTSMQSVGTVVILLSLLIAIRRN